jgi:hypothetical protein
MTLRDPLSFLRVFARFGRTPPCLLRTICLAITIHSRSRFKPLIRTVRCFFSRGVRTRQTLNSIAQKCLFNHRSVLEQLIALAITRPIANPKAPTTALAPSIAQYVGNGRVSVTAGGPGSAPITEKCSSTIEPLIPVQTTPSGEVVIDKNGNLQLDYNMIIPPDAFALFPQRHAGDRVDRPCWPASRLGCSLFAPSVRSPSQNIPYQ